MTLRGIGIPQILFNTLAEGGGGTVAPPPAVAAEPEIKNGPPAARNAPATAEEFKPFDLDSPTGDPADNQPASPARAEPAAVVTPPPGNIDEPTVAEPEPGRTPPPSLEPPRSWTAEDKELFKALPPETQKRIADRERARELEFRRGQDDTAVAKRAAEQERQRYAEALPHVTKQLLDVHVGEFKDLLDAEGKGWDQAKLDVLAREDWPRYIQFSRGQDKLKQAAAQLQQVQHEQAQAQQRQHADYAQTEDNAFKAKVPEMADQAYADELQKDALKMLTEYGFDEEKDLVPAWNRDRWLRDHRLQMVIRDAVQWRRAQAKAAAAVPVATPKPQAAGQGAPPRSGKSDLAQAADDGNMEAYIKLRNKQSA